jgi:hypothetical protein
MDSRFDAAQLQQAGLLINTADYCQTTALEVSPSQLFATGIEYCTDTAGRENPREDSRQLQGESNISDRTRFVHEVFVLLSSSKL